MVKKPQCVNDTTGAMVLMWVYSLKKMCTHFLDLFSVGLLCYVYTRERISQWSYHNKLQTQCNQYSSLVWSLAKKTSGKKEVAVWNLNNRPCHYYRRIADAIFSPVEINKYDNAVQTNKQIFSLHKSYIFTMNAYTIYKVQ